MKPIRVVKDYFLSFDDELCSEVIGKKILFGRIKSETNSFVPVLLTALFLLIAVYLTYPIAYLTIGFTPNFDNEAFYMWVTYNVTLALGICSSYFLKRAYIKSLDNLRESKNITPKAHTDLSTHVSLRLIRIIILLFFWAVSLRNWVFISPLEVVHVNTGVITNTMSTGWFGYIGACWFSITQNTLTAIMMMDLISLAYLAIIRPWLISQEKDNPIFKLNIVHSDLCGGLKPLGSFALVLSSVIFFILALVSIILTWVVLTFDIFAEGGPAAFNIPVIIISGWLMGFIVYFLSQYSVHKSMKFQKEIIQKRFRETINEQGIEKPTTDYNNSIVLLQLLESKKIVDRVRDWPYDMSTLRKLALAAITPLAIQLWITFVFIYIFGISN